MTGQQSFTEKHVYTYCIPKGYLVTYQPHTHVFGLWMEAREPMHSWGEHAERPYARNRTIKSTLISHFASIIKLLAEKT